MGSPQNPTPEQYRALEAAGHLAALHAPKPVDIGDRRITLKVELPRQGVSLLELDW
jgi:xylan 1,4-beta-xylosidase